MRSPELPNCAKQRGWSRKGRALPPEKRISCVTVSSWLLLLCQTVRKSPNLAVYLGTVRETFYRAFEPRLIRCIRSKRREDKTKWGNTYASGLLAGFS